jgi:hypothetical protein
MLCSMHLVALLVFVGYDGAFAALEKLPFGSKPEFLWGAISQIEWSLIFFGVLLCLMLVVIVAWYAGKLGRGRPTKMILVDVAALLVLAATALPFQLTQRQAFAGFAEKMTLSWTLRHMQGTGTCFMDRGAVNWEDLRTPGFIGGLTGEEHPVGYMPPEAELFEVLGDQGKCLAARASEYRAIAKDEDRDYFMKGPVTCLSPAQAKLYCETIGARLPTREEWSQVLVGMAPVEGRDLSEREYYTQFRRPGMTEWAMEAEHGTPVFYRMSATDGEEPVEVLAGTVEEGTTFRCAFTFD